MRLVPNPSGRSRFAMKASVIGLILLAGFVFAIHRGSRIAAAVWAVLQAFGIVWWARDLKNAIQRKGGTGRT